jgi:hypothetical protein
VRSWVANSSFPGFGTSHSTAAYGDHGHSGVYLPVSGAGDIYTHNASEFVTGTPWTSANTSGTSGGLSGTPNISVGTCYTTGNLGVGTSTTNLAGNTGRILTISSTATHAIAGIELQGNQEYDGWGVGAIDFFNTTHRLGTFQYFSDNNNVASGTFAIFTSNNGSNTEKMRVQWNGNVAIGTTDPEDFKIYINGTGFLNSSAWTYSSDRRLKENINYIDSGLDIICKLKPARFDYIAGEKRQAGFIAQDVQEILPDIITKGAGGMLAMKTESIIPYLVRAIQEQQKEIEALKQRIN